MDFQASLRLGEKHELCVAAWLHARGWTIHGMACRDWHPRAIPVLRSADHTYPDLLVERYTIRRWIDVKSKRRADWYRIGQRYVTGFPVRHWVRYWDVQQQTGIPVWIMFLHQQDDEALSASLETLSRCISHTAPQMGGMIFFRRDDIPRLASYREIMEA